MIHADRILRRILTLFTLVVLAATFSHVYAQDTEEELPEEIIAPDGNPADISNGGHFCFTNGTLYLHHETSEGDSLEQIWSAPTSRTISQVGEKEIGTNAAGDPIYSTTFILLDNGDVYEVLSDPFGLTVRYKAHIDISPNSETWKKIVGDDLYALSSSYVYVSRDAGSSWSVDSAGLHGISVNGIAIDSAQTVFAAAQDGIYSQALSSNTWARIASFPLTSNVASIFAAKHGHLYAGTYGNRGTYVSTDNGTTWTLDTAGAGSKLFSTFAEDSTGTVFAVGPGRQNGNSNGGLYRSLAGTNQWTPIDDGILAITNGPVSIRSVSAQKALTVATNFGIFVSFDQGNSWAYADSGLQAEKLSGLIKNKSGQLVAGTTLGIFHTVSVGRWVRSYPSTGFTQANSIFQDNNGRLYSVTSQSAAIQYGMPPIIMSTDGGTTWAADTAGLSGVIGTTYYVDELGNEHIASTSYSSSIMGLLYSKAPGGSWTVDTSGFAAAIYSAGYSFASDHNGYIYASGSFPKMAQVVRRPTSGGAWTVDTAGLSTLGYFSAMTAGRNGEMYGFLGSKLFHRTGNSWSRLMLPPSLPSPSIRCISVDSTGALFVGFSASSSPGGVYFTTDNGETWIHSRLDSISIQSMVSYGDSTFVLTSARTWHLSSKLLHLSSLQDSVDTGWNLVSVPFTRSNNSVSSLFPDRIAGSTYEYKKGYVSRDTLVPGKGYWTKFTSPAADTLRGTALASASVSVDTGWNIIGSVDHATAAPSGGIITSNVYGYSHGYSVATNLVPGKGYWVKTSGSGTLMLGAGSAPKLQPVRLSDMNSLTIRDAAGNNQTLYFGGASTANPDLFELPPPPPAGTFDARFSTNRMAEFADGNTEREIPIAISAVFPITISWEPSSKQHSSGDLIIGTRTKSLSIAGQVTVVHADDQLRLRIAKADPQTVPARFALEQAYPNPFNPSTLIRYSIPADDRVTLTVYNVLGQEVIKLVNADQKSGEYQVRFDGSNIPSGVYFYRLQAGDKSEVRKLMLLR